MKPTSPGPKVLLVDDEEALLRALTTVLKRAGCEVIALSDPIEALAAVADPDLDVALLDINLPHLSGIDLLNEIKLRQPHIEVVMMTGYATVETALGAVRAGAYDYLTKPFENIEHLVLTIRKAFERKQLLNRNRVLETMLSDRGPGADFVGQSARMKSIFSLIDTVSPSNTTVLIRGESGTGKELVARAIHSRSRRKDKPFLAINCSALTDTLLESELFGHVKGAFTGAVNASKGLFEAADGGTLFLDEIGDVSPQMQVRLLRVLQEGEIRAVGAKEVTRVDVRVIAATHVSLEKAIDDGRFREDLYYRLNVISLELPALRDRPEDIPLLAHHFLQKFAVKLERPAPKLSTEFVEALVAHNWPGNVRELQNAMERAVLLTQGGEVMADALPAQVRRNKPVDTDAGSLAHLTFAQAKKLAVSAFERRYLAAILKRNGGVLAAAARDAGLDRSNFRRLLRQHGMAGASGIDEHEEVETDEAVPS